MAPRQSIQPEGRTSEDFVVNLGRFVDEFLTRHHIEHVVFFGPGQHDAFWTACLSARRDAAAAVGDAAVDARGGAFIMAFLAFVRDARVHGGHRADMLVR